MSHNPGGPGWQEPGHTYHGDQYGQPTYGQPTYGQPTYEPTYGQPTYGQPAYGALPPGRVGGPPRSSALGLVSFGVLVVAMVVGTVWTRFSYAELSSFQAAGEPQEALTASLTAYALGCVALWLVGVVTFVLGIVATATDRGRAWGIVTIVLSVMAPFLTVGIGAALSGAR